MYVQEYHTVDDVANKQTMQSTNPSNQDLHAMPDMRSSLTTSIPKHNPSNPSTMPYTRH